MSVILGCRGPGVARAPFGSGLLVVWGFGIWLVAGKSITVGRVLVGHRILTNRNIRILIVSRTKGAASKTVRFDGADCRPLKSVE